MLRDKPVQITIDALGLAEIISDVVIRYHDLPDSIVSDKDSFFTSKFWCPRYHFQAWLRIYVFELNCGCRPHGSYEEDIGPRSRSN